MVLYDKSVLNVEYEERRLKNLARYDVIGKGTEASLDHVVRLATKIFNVPTSLVSFVDRDMQWFKAKVGLDLCETSREVSFCSHAIQSTNVLVVPDATKDERFKNNPLVTGAPSIRFYAGAPLMSQNGYALGSLCIIDDKPRAAFSEEDQNTLQSLARLAMDQIELKRLSETRRAALCLNRTSKDAIMHMNAEGAITYANRAARSIFGYSKEELLGSSINALLPVALQRRLSAVIRRFKAERVEFLSFPSVESVGVHKSGHDVPIEFSAGIWSSDDSFRMGVIARDISERRQREATFQLLFDRNPVPMWIFDAQTLNFMAVNDAACSLYEYPKSQALKLNALDIRLPEERLTVKATILGFEDVYQSEVPGTQVTATGKKLRILTFARRMHYHGRDCVVVANIDVTEREQSVLELKEAQIFLDTIIESIPSMVFVKDARDGRFVLLNKAGESLLGLQRKDLIGKTDFDILEPSEAERFRKADQEVIASQRLVTIENEPLPTPYGVRSLRTQKVSVPDLDGNPRYLLGISEDVTERLRVEERNRHLSFHDILTDLPNRRSFQLTLDQQLTLEKNRFALLLLDLDRFKFVNDSMGHHIGDALLRELSTRLNTSLGPSDFLARLGGDEFGIIHRDATKKSAAALAARITSQLSKPFAIDGRFVTVGVSAGIVLSPDGGRTSDGLIKRADLALYAAKDVGKSAYAFFEPTMEEKADTERLLRDELAVALKNHQFEVVYQPIVDTRSGKIVCCEALLRWRHPELGIISPADFIPVAEASGMIEPIGKWVLEQACKEAINWPEDVRVAVNLSPRQFAGASIAGMVSKVLEKTHLAPNRLELEITESIFLNDSDDNVWLLNELKQLGIRIALDDFGTGYSSLGYLRKFSFDKLKIDRSFVADLEKEDGNMAIVRAVIGLGRSFGATVTAEGVESPDQYARLRDEGCDQCQGFLLSRPVAAVAVRELFKSFEYCTAC